MTYTRRTGGLKKFRYSKEDIRRIQQEDTDSTSEFKESYRKWSSNRHHKRESPRRRSSTHSRRQSMRSVSSNSNNSKNKIIILSIVSFLVLFVLFGSIPHITTQEIEKIKIVRVNKTIPNQISFSSYIEDPYAYERMNVTLKGYLMRYIEGTEMAGVFVESLKDDKGNRIDFSYMPRNYVGLFPRTGETEQLYEVKGQFKRKYKTILLEVDEIRLTERDVAEVKEVDEQVAYTEEVRHVNFTRVSEIFLSLTSKIGSRIDEKTSELELQDKSEEIKESVDEISEKAQGIIMKIADTGGEVKDIIVEEIEDFSKPINETEIENQIFVLINKERERNGRHHLVRNTYLDNLAKSHSGRMIEENFFEHSNFNLGENIALTPIHSSVVGCGSTYSSTSQANCFVSGWISSPGHHANMLMYQYVSTGIGVSCSSTECKATQVFR